MLVLSLKNWRVLEICRLDAAAALIACVFVLAQAGFSQTSSAQVVPSPSKEDLVKSLKCHDEKECLPPSASRRRGLGPPIAKRGFAFQPLSEDERRKLDEAARLKKLPSADIEIYFDLDQAVITPAAQNTLRPLGEALIDSRLAHQQFVLIGHTDARGNDAYNQTLSERRATAAKDYLIKTFGIAPDRLTSYGRGKRLLKNAADPLAGENRRVQVVNYSAMAADEVR